MCVCDGGGVCVHVGSFDSVTSLFTYEIFYYISDKKKKKKKNGFQKAVLQFFGSLNILLFPADWFKH